MSRRVTAEASGSRGRRGREPAAAAAGGHSPAERPAKLPRYERPAFTMSEPVRQALGNLSTNPEAYESRLQKAAKLLPRVVGLANDRVYERRSQLEQKTRRRAAKNIEEKPEEELHLENLLARLEEEVFAASMESEAALRDVIDRQHAVQSTKDALRDANTAVRAQPLPPSAAAPAAGQPARPRFEEIEDVEEFLAGIQNNEGEAEEANEDDGSEDDGSRKKKRRASGKDAASASGPRGPPGPLHFFTKAREEATDKYARVTPHEKYALNNEYASLKRMWHDALHPDNDEELPDASRWFDRDGNPVLEGANDDAGQNGEDDDDDDVRIERAPISTICDLTQLPINEPFTSRKCPHTFEKQAIIDMFNGLRGQRDTRCPKAGCVAILRVEDFYVDEVMARRIKRARERAARENNMEDDDDEDGTANDESMVETGARNIGRNLKRERADR